MNIFIGKCVVVLITVLSTAFIIHQFIIKDIMRRMKYSTKMSIVEVFGSIDIIITNETALYEKYLANTTDMNFTAMTNSQFINVYNDLASRVLHAFSPGFIEMANVYLTTDELNTYAAQMVYNFLADKIQTIPETAQDMDDEDVETEDGNLWV